MPNSEAPLAIVFVDDDELYRSALATLLSRNNEFAVLEAENYDGLMDHLKRQTVDCVVLDYNLGAETGLAIHERMKDHLPDPPPVVMLTGDGRERTVIKAFKGGVSDYLPKKGLERADLSRAIRAAVQQKRSDRMRQAEQERLKRLSVFDDITGLYSSAHMSERLEAFAAHSKRADARCALFLIAVNDFGSIVDRFGQVMGDRVLRAVAAKLKTALRSADLCGRDREPNGFLVIVDTDPDPHFVERFRDQLLNELTFKADFDRVSLPVSVSIGAGLFPDDGTRIADVLQAARRFLLAAQAAKGVVPDDPSRFNPEGGATALQGLVIPNAAPDLSVAGSRETGEARQVDRRKERRQRVFKKGQIVLEGIGSAIDCTIKDLSPGGARLKIDNAFAVPERFELFVPSTGERRRVAVRWQIGDELGVQYTDKPSP